VALVATTYHTNLTRLELNECFEVTDNSLASLSEQCTNIKALHLGYCQYITGTLISFRRHRPTAMLPSAKFARSSVRFPR
jgi:hypothetical protein